MGKICTEGLAVLQEQHLENNESHAVQHVDNKVSLAVQHVENNVSHAVQHVSLAVLNFLYCSV